MKFRRPQSISSASPLAARAFQPTRASRWQACAAGIAVLLAASQVGCAPFRGLRETIAYNDAVNDFVMGWRNSAWARQSWHERKWMYADQPQFVTFGQGYRDGYAAVAGGGNGCVPGLPPRHYWSWKYQTGEGQAKVAAWFAGYPHGARAAQEDGAGNFQQIQVSHLIEAEYSPEFRAGKCPDWHREQVPGVPFEDILPGVPEESSLDPAPTPARQTITDPTSQAIPRGAWAREPVNRELSLGGGIFPGITSDESIETGGVVPASAVMPAH